MTRLFTSFAVAAAVSVAAMAASPASAALKPGAKVPDFTLPAFQGGKPFTYKLSDNLKKGPVVLYFFPAAFTGGCDLEAHLFSQAADDYQKAGATVIGVTAGNLDRLAEFSADNARCSGKFPVAADKGAKIAKEYESTMPVGGMSNRTSYVITPDGKVLYVHSKLDPNEHVTLTMQAIKDWRAKGGK